MKVLAAIASSPGGRLYAQVSHLWGVDPAAFLSDDILALNFRMALSRALASEDGGEGVASVDAAARHIDLVERARAGVAELRRLDSG